MTPLSCDNLDDLIAKRHRCLTQLRDLGHKQTKLIAEGEMAALLRLISAKNQLILALQTIEKELAPFHAQVPEERCWPSEKQRLACAARASECRQLLDEVMQLERENEEKMIDRRDQVATRLQAAQATNQARSAYQAQQRVGAKHPNFSVEGATPSTDTPLHFDA